MFYVVSGMTSEGWVGVWVAGSNGVADVLSL